MRLTVIMPVYNAMPFLADAVDSITSQTYSQFRFLVVDDGSTDGSETYLKTVSDERVSVIRSPNRRGQGAARNLALARCDTEYTAFMDADDVSLKNRFARQLKFLDGSRDIGVVGTKVLYIGDSGRRGFAPPLALSHEEIRKDLLERRHALVNATMMCRTDILQEVGGFRIDGAGEDWDLFLRLTERTRVANLDEILYLYRVHRTSTNAAQSRQMRLRYAHACECARIRCAGGVETTFDSFCDRQQGRSLWESWVDRLDEHSSVFYREALQDILNGRPLTGYPRLLLAAAVSPKRLLQRARRVILNARPIARIISKVNWQHPA